MEAEVKFNIKEGGKLQGRLSKCFWSRTALVGCASIKHEDNYLQSFCKQLTNFALGGI